LAAVLNHEEHSNEVQPFHRMLKTTAISQDHEEQRNFTESLRAEISYLLWKKAYSPP
jgi:hypothetical protein